MFHPKVKSTIEAGTLGSPQMDRLPFLLATYERWQAGIVSKRMSLLTIKQYWVLLRKYVTFCEQHGRPLEIDSALDSYLHFCHHIKQRSDLKAETKNGYAIGVATIVGPLVGMDAGKLKHKSRIVGPRRLGNSTAKENLASTADFIQTLLETIEQLSVEAVRGPLLVTFRYSSGAEHTIHCGKEFKSIDSLKGDPYQKRASVVLRTAREKDISNKRRAPLINLRLEAELLLFISQTSCNLTQALQLTGGHYRYRSEGDYLQMFVWKNRAKHDVELRIHRSYRSHFESYLAWRSTIFPGDQDGLTFPFIRDDGELTMHRTSCAFTKVRALVASIGKPFVHAQQLRVTAGNFVKRGISRQAAAELLSNSEVTFRERYEEVHQQTATAELVRFWGEIGDAVSAVGPGACKEMAPNAYADSPPNAPKPDCESPASCLFCDKNRDIRSFDHVWNLASLRQLKVAELNADRTPFGRDASHPVALSVQRISDKLNELRLLGGEYAQWVQESLLRVDEGNYHRFYAAEFEVLESFQ